MPESSTSSAIDRLKPLIEELHDHVSRLVEINQALIAQIERLQTQPSIEELTAWEQRKGAAIRQAYAQREYTDLDHRRFTRGLDGWFTDAGDDSVVLIRADEMTAKIAAEFTLANPLPYIG